MRRLKVEEKRLCQSHVYKNAGGVGEWGEGGREEERGRRGGEAGEGEGEEEGERKEQRNRKRERKKGESIIPGKSQRQVAH